MTGIASEEWREVKDNPGYEVSSTGRVRSKDRMITHHTGSKFVRKGRTLTVHYGERGYGQVTLTGSGRWKTHAVHRLVAETFLGRSGEGLVVRHLDGDKTNNSVENLEYGTPYQNSQDQKRHGTVRKGSKHPMSKLTEKEILEIRDFKGSNRAAADKYGVSNQLISRIKRRELWRHI